MHPSCFAEWHGLHRFELEGADAQMPVEGVESIEEAAAYVFLHPATTAEVRALSADLQVLGRSEFKQLLKWCAPKSLHALALLLQYMMQCI